MTILEQEPFTKQALIEILIKQPEDFTLDHLNTLLGISNQSLDTNPIWATELVDVTDLRRCILRIFDQNEDYKFDNAYVGYLGKLNNWSQRKRNKRFIQKIKKNNNLQRIVAGGDSWFEHPVSKDIIDWINILEKDEVAIYSIARGGDFLTNILEEREYITEVSLIEPDVFMLSAGGIEIVNHRKVALMVDMKRHYITEEIKEKHPLLKKVLNSSNLTEEDKARMEHGLKFVTIEFFALLGLLELSYKYLIKQLRKKFPELKMIVHGYDYPVPSFQRGPIYRPIKYLMNVIGDNGIHFKQPLTIKKIIDPVAQRDIGFAMLYLFNEMLINVVNDPVFGHEVYHIDCRGYANDNLWFDELHLKPKYIKKVAQTFLECIQNTDPTNKVFKVTSLHA